MMLKEAIAASVQGIKLDDFLRERDTNNQDNMEEEALAAMYWCHVCSQRINPVSEMDMQCPFCLDGFVEELERSTIASDGHNTPVADFRSNQALSYHELVSPDWILKLSQILLDDGDDSEAHLGGETEYDRQLDYGHGRRMGSSGTVQQLLQGTRAGLASESYANSKSDEHDKERERERVTIVQGSYDSSQGECVNHSPNLVLGLLLQHFASYGPNRMSKFSKRTPAWDFIVMHPVISERFKQFKNVVDVSFLDEVVIFCDTILQHSGFGLAEVLLVTDSTISLGYTLSLKVTEDLDVTENESVTRKIIKENVHLKFKRLGGHFIILYGSLSDGTFEVHRLCFDEKIHAPTLASENETFELWKKVRNGLALPLMNDACRKAKLKPPTHFMDLPKECFVEILKRLPAVDITMMACSSKEMKHLFLRSMFLEEIPVRDTGRRIMRLSSSSIHPKQG